MTTRTTSRHAGDTKARILDAAETLFIECGYEAMSLRQITSKAEVNLAAVNYHFGSKEALMHAMLARRLDLLNQERVKLLDRFDAMLGTRLTCEHVLGAMFIPALRVSRDTRIGGKAFLRLLGRAYTDPSPFIRDFLNAHYASVSVRFFDAFQRALPHLPREELGWRLHFAIGALSGVLAGADTDSLISEFSQGKSMNDLQLIARLASLIVSALKAPLPDASQLAVFASVLGDAGSADIACDAVRQAAQDGAQAASEPQTPSAPQASQPHPSTDAVHRSGLGSFAQPAQPAQADRPADTRDYGAHYATHG
ncbi:TetR/AcrR family transcriptional regulator [Paraburkholderia caribensis]|uniref:TetR/AcrR family transcriptional regulator n=1 Tax=Paraburkholderia caribensis TaxID=75105 RepID=UPI0007218731|nr:TetR/AcrR family transcriptional regulator [Paraburkholderia caribensis]ALP62742.1 TetR family transcriptional regulator [Paraburkholderia caribensis]AUT52024.1 TetR/AcrR family transcriptional regulator [Paraburkholderia caribensis]MDR6380128.1 AcrR family transcriptional regulator [Paraburkholderia caribensis]